MRSLTQNLVAKTRHFKHVFLVVFTLIFLSVLLVIWAVSSPDFAGRIIAFAIDRVNARGKISLDLQDLTGSIASGLRAGRFQLKQLHPPMHLTADNLAVNLDLSSFQKGLILIGGAIGNIEAIGMGNSRLASATIPDYHALGCFAGLPANFIVSSFSIDTLNFQPWQDFPLRLSLQDLKIRPASETFEQTLAMNVSAEWRQRNVGSGCFTGFARPRKSRIDGRLAIGMIGQRLETEISINEKRGRAEISGYIATASMNIAAVSHWLVPMWQDIFPFGFDGSMDFAGSWLYNEKTGFLGNISGKIVNLRMVALGLFLAIVELNGNWRFFDGTFDFADSGSRVLGFPASLSGKVEAVFDAGRKWQMDLICNSVDFARLADDLPWGIKYGLALPDVSGIASMQVLLRGVRPEISADISLQRLVVGKDHECREISGVAGYTVASRGPGKFLMQLECRQPNLPSPFWQRFRSRFGTFAGKMTGFSAPYDFQYSLSGSGFRHLVFSGSLSADQQCVAALKGDWHDGMGSIQLHSGLAGENQEYYHASHIPFLDLILAR